MNTLVICMIACIAVATVSACVMSYRYLRNILPIFPFEMASVWILAAVGIVFMANPPSHPIPGFSMIFVLCVLVPLLIFWCIFGLSFLSYMNNHTHKMSAFTRIFLHPYYTDGTIDMEWDAALNKAIDDKLPVKIMYGTIMLGNQEVWACNFPYAYGQMYGNIGPKRSTAYRLRIYIKEATGIDLKNAIAYHEQIKNTPFNF